MHFDVADSEKWLAIEAMVLSTGPIADRQGHSLLQILGQVVQISTLLPFLLDFQTLSEHGCVPHEVPVQRIEFNLERKGFRCVNHGEACAIVAKIDCTCHLLAALAK